MAYRSLLLNVPALAYSSKPEDLSSCRLTIKYSDTRNQASVVLCFLAHIYGFEEEQSFVYTYDADNITPASFLRSTTENLNPSDRSAIARNNVPIAKTLNLALRKPCVVRCPPSTGSIASKSGHEAHFTHLRGLARALELCIIFDHNYLHANSYAAFHSLVYRPEKLYGIPSNHYQGPASRQADWTVFVPIEDDDEHEEPPLYADVTAKRHRQVSVTSLPEASPSKRVCTTPPPIETLAPGSFHPLPGSPTEKATTTTASPTPSCPPSPYKAPALLDVVGNAVETMVPHALQKILPDMLSDLFEVPSSPKRDLHTKPSIGARITARLVADAEPGLTKLLKKIEADTESHELDLRRHTDAQFYEEIENYKIDVTSAKEEALAEIRFEIEKLTQELTDVANAKVKKLSEDVQGLVDEAFVEVYDNLNDLVEKKKPELRRQVRKILSQEKERAEVERVMSRGRRAVSLPL